MASNLELARKALGQLFIVGFSGLELSIETSTFLTDSNIGGVILFSGNYESPGQVAELINEIQECRKDLPFWISVDHEGGRVQRFRKFFTRIPDAQAIGAMDSPRLTFEIAEIMAKELKAIGINLNFAPVADINTNPKNPVIGPRAFGADEESVTKHTTAIVRGHLVQGVQPCVKHFPGHGDTSVDTHFSLAKVDTDLDTLINREFKPFTKAFRSHCNMVMSTHVICTQLDPDYPATLSKKILTGILRDLLRYTGLIISDDMEMKAIADHFGAADAPRLAIEAGCDLLIYRSEAAGRFAYQSLLKALEDGTLDPKLVLAAEKRILGIKKDTLLPYTPAIVAQTSEKIGIPAHLFTVDKVADLSKSRS